MNEEFYATCGFAISTRSGFSGEELTRLKDILTNYLKDLIIVEREPDRVTVINRTVGKDDVKVEFVVERVCGKESEYEALQSDVRIASVKIAEEINKMTNPSTPEVKVEKTRPTAEPREGYEWCAQYAMGSVDPVGWYEVPTNTYNYRHGCDCRPLIGSSIPKRKLMWIKTNEGRLVNVKQIVTVWIRNSTPYEVIASTNSSAFPIYSGTLEKCQEAMEDLYNHFTLEDTSTVELNDEVGSWNPL